MTDLALRAFQIFITLCTVLEKSWKLSLKITELSKWYTE